MNQPKAVSALRSATALHGIAYHASLVSFSTGVDVKEHADDDQHQAFHEDEEAGNKCSVIVVSILEGDEGAESKTPS
jgi:hypothetical protein